MFSTVPVICRAMSPGLRRLPAESKSPAPPTNDSPSAEAQTLWVISVGNDQIGFSDMVFIYELLTMLANIELHCVAKLSRDVQA